MRKSLLILLALLVSPTIAYSEDSLKIEISSGLNLELIKCPAGQFLYGCSSNEVGYIPNNDLPLIQATIDKDFYISKFETTQALYKEIMGENPSKNQSNDLPVEKVTYSKAVEFCERLNEITSDVRPAGFEFMLPSEKQWEYACRAGTSTALNNGKNLENPKSECKNLEPLGWYKYNSDTKTHPIGQKQPNNWNIYDMHGNVAEWCSETVSKNDGKSYGILRGGAYFYEPQQNRAASRGSSLTDSVSSAFGFRVALVQTSEQSTNPTNNTPVPTPPVNNTIESQTVSSPASSDISNAVIKTDDSQTPASDNISNAVIKTDNVPAPSTSAAETTSTPVVSGVAPMPENNTTTSTPVVSGVAPMPENNNTTSTPLVSGVAPMPDNAVVTSDSASETTVSVPTETAPLPVSPYIEPKKAGEKISVSVNGVKFPLIGCPAGNYSMGSPANEPCHTDKENQRQVTIEKGFYIGKYEITQGQYKAIVGNNPSIDTGDKLPLHNINWLDAQNFCNKLNELTKDKRPAGSIFALPTEAQWEYACRSGYKTALNNGKNLVNFNGSDPELNKLAWYNANACDKIQTVGKKIANAWSIHDMHGNVWEWCSDKAGEALSNGKVISVRIAKGGSYKTKANECRAANRKEIDEDETLIDFGIRIILIEQK